MFLAHDSQPLDVPGTQHWEVLLSAEVRSTESRPGPVVRRDDKRSLPSTCLLG